MTRTPLLFLEDILNAIERIESYTILMIARGESKTDWQRIRRMTDEDIEENADQDLDSPAYPYPDNFWKDAKLVPSKQRISSSHK